MTENEQQELEQWEALNQKVAAKSGLYRKVLLEIVDKAKELHKPKINFPTLTDGWVMPTITGEGYTERLRSLFQSYKAWIDRIEAQQADVVTAFVPGYFMGTVSEDVRIEMMKWNEEVSKIQSQLK